jgi:hypothetical protein
MRISDAKPGDVLQDNDGDIWVVLPDGLVSCLMGRSRGPVRGLTDRGFTDHPDTVEVFGPFARLVPEQEPTDAP